MASVWSEGDRSGCSGLSARHDARRPRRRGVVRGLLPASWAAPACFIVLLIGGGLCAAAAGLIVGLPALRLRGDYLAIATLGFAEIIRIAIQNAPPLGGPLGLGGIQVTPISPGSRGRRC